MRRWLLSTLTVPVLVTAVFAVAWGSATQRLDPENAYYLYTATQQPSPNGVFRIPSRYQWSVETCGQRRNAQGQTVPDDRIMLRLYDPENPVTAMIAQMNQETAEQLRQDLTKVINGRQRDPGFQHRPQLHQPGSLPKGELVSIDASGAVTVKLTYPDSNRVEFITGPPASGGSVKAENNDQ